MYVYLVTNIVSSLCVNALGEVCVVLFSSRCNAIFIEKNYCKSILVEKERFNSIN